MTLPPLPEASGLAGYTEAQMLAYGAACAAAERERCAKVCEDIENTAWSKWDKWHDPHDQSREIGAAQCAAAIRAPDLVDVVAELARQVAAMRAELHRTSGPQP